MVTSGPKYRDKPNPLSSYRDLGITHWKLDEAVRRFRERPQADFLIELGDLKSYPPSWRPPKATTADILDACARLDKWGGAVYHVAGNHDLQMVARKGVKSSADDWDAYIAALEAALALGARDVELRMDSELVVRQLDSRYKVRNPSLRRLFGRVKDLQWRFASFQVRHVGREQNRRADGLANEALDRG